MNLTSFFIRTLSQSCVQITQKQKISLPLTLTLLFELYVCRGLLFTPSCWSVWSFWASKIPLAPPEMLLSSRRPGNASESELHRKENSEGWLMCAVVFNQLLWPHCCWSSTGYPYLPTLSLSYSFLQKALEAAALPRTPAFLTALLILLLSLLTSSP